MVTENHDPATARFVTYIERPTIEVLQDLRAIIYMWSCVASGPKLFQRFNCMPIYLLRSAEHLPTENPDSLTTCTLPTSMANQLQSGSVHMRLNLLEDDNAEYTNGITLKPVSCVFGQVVREMAD